MSEMRALVEALLRDDNLYRSVLARENDRRALEGLSPMSFQPLVCDDLGQLMEFVRAQAQGDGWFADTARALLQCMAPLKEGDAPDGDVRMRDAASPLDARAPPDALRGPAPSPAARAARRTPKRPAAGPRAPFAQRDLNSPAAAPGADKRART